MPSSDATPLNLVYVCSQTSTTSRSNNRRGACQRSRYRLPHPRLAKYCNGTSSLIHYITGTRYSTIRVRYRVSSTSYLYTIPVQVCPRHCSTGQSAGLFCMHALVNILLVVINRPISNKQRNKRKKFYLLSFTSLLPSPTVYVYCVLHCVLYREL